MLRGMKLKDILNRFETIAPLSLAESWDKVGLHAGSDEQRVSKAMLCIDLTPQVVTQAMAAKAQLVVAYHPPIFEPLSTLSPVSWKHEALLACVKRGIAIFSPHTALDAAPDGLNDWLSSGVGPGDVVPLRPQQPETIGKLVIFVPSRDADALRQALHEAGAGRLGHYSKCTFNVTGQGTFQGDETSQPAVGKAGRFERVEEVRMEMIFPWALRHAIAKVAREHHPYEEAAMDMYELAPAALPATGAGQGRIVTLARPVTLATLAQRIGKLLGVSHLSVNAAAGRGKKIRTIGLCAGAGGSLLGEAGAIDAFFTGEMRYHDVLDATQRGVNILLAGHVQTERPYLKILRQRLASLTGRDVSWAVAKE